jgi:hypothetical protein
MPARERSTCSVGFNVKIMILGGGVQGTLYAVRLARFGFEAEVAIKVLPPFVSQDGDRLRRFEQEAQAAAHLWKRTLASYYFVIYRRFEETQGAEFRI